MAKRMTARLRLEERDLTSRWVREDSPARQVILVSLGLGRRRLGLFAAGCCRSSAESAVPMSESLPADYLSQTMAFRDARDRAIALLERWADEAVAADEIDAFRSSLTGLNRGVEVQVLCAIGAEIESVVGCAQFAVATSLRTHGTESRRQSLLLHGLSGGEFALSPDWRTDTAVSLARQMYESRDFGAMPILADALQDAGCDSTEWLVRMRDADWPWCRGCRILDSLLGW